VPFGVKYAQETHNIALRSVDKELPWRGEVLV
jgi:hypothetical protein